jgi:tRNA 2-thiouridine synthesizing protein C
MENKRKNIMIVVRKAPHGSIYAQEAQEVMLIMAAYEMNLSVVFIDDGVFALKTGQNTQNLGTKSFLPTFTALLDWEVENVYLEKESLEQRNMTVDHIVNIGEDEDSEEPVKPEILTSAQIQKLMKQQDTVLSF